MDPGARPTRRSAAAQDRPGDSTEDEDVHDQMDESMDPREESGGTVSDDEQDEVDDAVADDMNRFANSFANINQRYRLINRIGEGTFSTVYKAEDLLYDRYENDWDLDEGETRSRSQKTNGRSCRARFVAIKKIYVTSSPIRILNELELLNDLRDSPNVCPLITAFRHQDQVIAILPFFQHKDFREYYRELTMPEVRVYLHNLFMALSSVHAAEIIHRDIKPTNFLYSPSQRRGVLVDFGLAEREGTEFQKCNCYYEPRERTRKVQNSIYAATLGAADAVNQPPPRPTYPINDQRPSRRANRAGTRGFRAPEVLLKCTAQRCEIDIWSCGVILLTFLSGRFPFFHSADDVDAFIELTSIFGRRRMREVGLLHGQVVQCNIPTISETGHSWEKIVLWCNGRRKPSQDGGNPLSPEEQEAVDFMRLCLDLDVTTRMTADQAMVHPFLADAHQALREQEDARGY